MFKSYKSQKRSNRMKPNPFKWKGIGLSRSAIRQINYMRKNWKKKRKFALPVGLERA